MQERGRDRREQGLALNDALFLCTLTAKDTNDDLVHATSSSNHSSLGLTLRAFEKIQKNARRSARYICEFNIIVLNNFKVGVSNLRYVSN